MKAATTTTSLLHLLLFEVPKHQSAEEPKCQSAEVPLAPVRGARGLSVPLEQEQESRQRLGHRAGKTIIGIGYVLILCFSIMDCPGSRISILIVMGCEAAIRIVDKPGFLNFSAINSAT
jgi:hypothetical protein